MKGTCCEFDADLSFENLHYLQKFKGWIMYQPSVVFLKTKNIHQIIMNSNYTFRYELTDPKAQNIVRLITESVQVENIRFLFAMPWIRHFLPEITGWNTQKKVLR